MDTQTKHNTVISKANCYHFRIAGTLKIKYQSFFKQKFPVTHYYIFRLEVLTAVRMKIQVSWDVMLCRCTFYTHTDIDTDTYRFRPALQYLFFLYFIRNLVIYSKLQKIKPITLVTAR